MIKKRQKLISLMAMAAFAWLLHVSASPLAAAGATERMASAGMEQGPGFVEAEGTRTFPVERTSFLPYVLIGVGIVAVAFVLVLVIKTQYDITGSWRFIFTTGDNTTNRIVTFDGTKTGGKFVFMDDAGYAGNYTVADRDVTMTLTNFPTVQFSGRFVDRITMKGTWVSETVNWNWTAYLQ